MSSIYNKADNDLIISRINALTPESKALWSKMTYDDWDALMWKHVNHHLRQFGV